MQRSAPSQQDPFGPSGAGGRMILALGLLFLTGACGEAPEPDRSAEGAASDEAVHQAFLGNLGEHCGEAFEGTVTEVPDGDPFFEEGATLVMHVRQCSEREVRIPVHLGDDHSRTWIFSRTGGGIDLRHDHRHDDGTPEENTFYGAFVSPAPPAEEPPSPHRHEFKRVVDEETGMVSGWVVEILPGERYTYGTQRDGEWRHRFDFDLSRPVDPPPDPWGYPPVGEVPELPAEQEAFLANLAEHCGQAFEGEITRRPEGDELFRGDEVLTVHFRECEPDRMALPFHVEDNRSRTWLLTRTTAGLDLRHDHRHPDGSPEPSTWYGAHTRTEGTAERQEFLRRSGERAGSGWAIEIVPGERYTYGTIGSDGEWSYRLDFDLSEPVDPPPAPWGHEG